MSGAALGPETPESATTLAADDVIIRLRGGAGNQLFQYAAALSMVPKARIAAIRSTTDNQLSIEALLPGEVRFIDDPGTPLLDRLTQHYGRWRRLRQPMLPALRRLRRRHVYSQRGAMSLAYAARPQGFRVPRLLDGYFQHPSWIAAGRQQVVEELLSHSPSSFTIWRGATPYAAVCSRRGDFNDLGMAVHPGYFEEALDRIDPALPLVLIGDDRDHLRRWAEELTAKGRTVIAPPELDPDVAVNDFWLVVAANSVIMANSTFNWWATTVGDHCNADSSVRVVCCPAQWVGGFGTALRDTSWVPVRSG